MNDYGRTDENTQENSDDEESHRNSMLLVCLCARNSSASNLKSEQIVTSRNVIECIVI